AVAPLYIKAHSYGEYVFDHSWADAYQRSGRRYYPKLLCAVPFTPVTGPRLLCGGDEGLEAALISATESAAQQLGVSSVHINFPSEDVWSRLGARGLLQRQDQQFHFENKGYQCFADFLGELQSIKRKNLRRERAQAFQAGITIEWVTGSDIREVHWDAFYDFYMDTGSRKWGAPYLNREFFSRVGGVMADQILLILAKRDGRYIAGALNFMDATTLYGRNWGAIEHHPFLHFEVCYYQAIDFAIAKGLKRVEAGAQGAHKLARGYLPSATYSLHWIADPDFRDAIARYLAQERDAVTDEMTGLQEHAPFRRDLEREQE
ncbi:MAG TPA: GNAT family N-acetyltransferase, partial [Alphaproteobacteria bacterium]|nr:GNAT family N-acetyltransferase [Alphaproteobacteria bacterium]